MPQPTTTINPEMVHRTRESAIKRSLRHMIDLLGWTTFLRYVQDLIDEEKETL